MKFEIVDHGVEHAQYFQGCGVSFTPYTDVVTGAGRSPATALDNALEQLWSSYLPQEVTERLMAAIDRTEESRRLRASTIDPHEDCEEVESETHDLCELYYYVSIRWQAPTDE